VGWEKLPLPIAKLAMGVLFVSTALVRLWPGGEVESRMGKEGFDLIAMTKNGQEIEGIWKC